MKMNECNKFDSCSAPICPLDPDWKIRPQLSDERACFYLREYAKEFSRPVLRGSLPGEQHLAVVECYREVVDRKCPGFSGLRSRLKSAAKTGTKMVKPGEFL